MDNVSNALELDYYYGSIEAEQYGFYRIPKLLMTNERYSDLSSDAKLLYGLMLDRMAMSTRNGWFDEENRVYIIYTIDNIRKDLSRCSKEKAVKVLGALEDIGLVEKKRRGLGKPDIIYVKNFATLPEEGEKEPSNTDVSTEVGKTDFKKSEKPTSRGQENRLQEVGKADFSRSEKPTSVGRKNRPQEVGISDPNYNYKNNTDFSNININLSNQEIEVHRPNHARIDPMEMDEVNAYVQRIKDNLDYEHYMATLELGDRDLYKELCELICETVCVKRKTVKVNGEDYPYELVQSRFLELTSFHLEYVMDAMKNTATKISNIKAYMVTALYNAPNTMAHYYQQKVQHDMNGGGWEEKGIV